jgi:hypothetical protein
MMDLQNIIVGIIVLSCVVFLIWKYGRSKKGGCDACSCHPEASEGETPKIPGQDSGKPK